jgi:hypothetical protein
MASFKFAPLAEPNRRESIGRPRAQPLAKRVRGTFVEIVGRPLYRLYERQLLREVIEQLMPRHVGMHHPGWKSALWGAVGAD